MKRRIRLIRNSILAFLLAAMPFIVMAQDGQGLRKGREMKQQRGERLEEHISNLSDEQKESIKAIRLDKLNDVKDKRNALNEKNARLQTLRTSDEPDMKAIDNLVDEISLLKADIAKNEEKAIQEIRAILTEEQRAEFDMHMDKRRERVRQKIQE